MQTRNWAVDGQTQGGLVPPCELGPHIQTSAGKELLHNASPKLRMAAQALLHPCLHPGGIRVCTRTGWARSERVVEGQRALFPCCIEEGWVLTTAFR